MAHRILISGAGIGGLAAALALHRAGCEVQVIEAASELGEAGAGIQLGPNAMKVLAGLGLEKGVLQMACLPESIVIANAASGKPISRMLLGEAVRQRYGQVYASMHRADLHALLLAAVRSAGVSLHLNQSLSKYEHSAHEIQRVSDDLSIKADALIGADGLWSSVRQQMLQDGSPRATGHAAFRALVPAQAVPQALRTMHVRTWWAHDVHVVSYPLRGGALWNVVVLAEVADLVSKDAQGWSLAAEHAQVMRCFKQIEPQLEALLLAASHTGWRRWNLFDRAALPAKKIAQGRVALLGDAAHPMLPYLAQGAAMALEDAACLAAQFKGSADVTKALSHYAQLRAARTARVMRTARRNGQIFHLSGPMAIARNAVLGLQGTQVLGMPWLYGWDSA